MNLGDPMLLLSGVLIGLVGLVLFNYGRKEGNLRVLATGATLCVYPYFVGSVLVVWLLFAAIMGGWYALTKWA